MINTSSAPSVNLNDLDHDRIWNLKHTKDNVHTSWYARIFFGLSDGRMDYNRRLTMYGQNDMRSTTDKYMDGQQTNGRTVVKLRTNMCWRKTGRQRIDGQIRGRTHRQRTDGRADWRLTMYRQNDKHSTTDKYTDGQICFVTRLHSREKAIKILQLSSKFVTVEHGVVNNLTQRQLYWVNCTYNLLVRVNFEVKMCIERKFLCLHLWLCL